MTSKDSSSSGAISDETRITEQVLAYRKALLQFGEDDATRLAELLPLAEKYADDVIEEFYDHLMTFEEVNSYFDDPAVLERVKAMQKDYFLDLTRGNYEMEYVDSRIHIGEIHERINLPFDAYIGMYSFYLRTVGTRIFEAGKDPEEARATLFSLMKLIFMDIGLALDTYFTRRQAEIKFQQGEVIRLQQQELSELPTPVLRLHDRLLIVPIVGAIDSRRAMQLTEQLLTAIRDNRAKVIIIDVTGVPAIDSRVASHMLQTATSAQLMGGDVIFTGISAEIAQTLVSIGADLSGLHTVGDLQGGMEEAERLLARESGNGLVE